MSNIINKSNHPIEVKRIEVDLWPLRDEIEYAIAQRLEDSGDIENIDIEDIKEFYTRELQVTEASEDSSEEDAEIGADGMDSSGNPLDDDAMAMMAALGGGEEDTEGGDDVATEESSEENPDEAQDSSENESEENSEEDDEAAALAAQMLADQGMAPAPEESSDEDDEAAALAAQMLADQGMGAEPAPEEKKKEFQRPKPPKSKRIPGFVLLSDIQMDQVLLFTKQDYVYGQNIVINFKIPNNFSSTIEVIKTVNIGRNSKIISASKMDYRILGKFLFKFPQERENLRNFLSSIEPDIPEPPKALKKAEVEDDDDDDFDDLGF